MDRGAAPAPLTARLVGCRCWCRSWSSIRSVQRVAPAPRPPSPLAASSGLSRPVPLPAAPASRPPARLPSGPDPRGGHSCAFRVFAAAAEEAGLGGQRAQQELRGIGEILTSASRLCEHPPPAPFSGLPLAGRSDRAALRGGRADGRGAGASPGPRDCPRQGCFVLGVAVFVLVGNGPGGGGGGAGARRFAAGWAPGAPRLQVRGWG